MTGVVVAACQQGSTGRGAQGGGMETGVPGQFRTGEKKRIRIIKEEP